jgi:hypothetical protein
MVSNDPIKDYMQRHGCSFPEALEALAAQLGPPTARDIRRALQTLARAGAPVGLLEALEAWSNDQMQQAALDCAALIDPAGAAGAGYTRCW